MAPSAMFSPQTPTTTPSQQRVKRAKTYGKLSKPARNFSDEFIEGQDFVFAQKNAPKWTTSQLSLSKQEPRIAQQKNVPGLARSVTSPLSSRSPRKAATSTQVVASQTSSTPAKTEASIFDPPTSDDEPELYQILPTRLKKAVATARLNPSVIMKPDFPPRRIAKENTTAESKVTSPARPKLVKSATDAPRPGSLVKEKDVFDVQSSEEENVSSVSGKKLKRLPLKRAATLTRISPKRGHDIAAAGTAVQPVPVHHQAKRPRLSASPKQSRSAAATPLSSPSSSFSRRSSQRTPQRQNAAPPKFGQLEKSAPAALSSMINQDVQSLFQDEMQGIFDYVPPSRHRYSSGSQREVTPITVNVDGIANRTPATTPRQEKLWEDLLQVDPKSPSSAKLPAASTVVVDLFKSPEAVPMRRKLADTLRAVAEPSSDAAPSEDLEDEDDDESMEDEAQDSQTPPKTVPTRTLDGPSVTTRLTYASQRSFLAASADAVEDFSQPLEVFEALAIPTVPSLSQSQQRQPSAQTSDDEEEGTKTMRSVHELRAAGGSRRFEDEVHLGDLEGSGKAATSRRRSALMELCKRLLSDAEFQRRFSQAGTVCQVFERCKAERDGLTQAVVAAVVAMALQDSKSSTVATQLYAAGVLSSLTQPLIVIRDMVSISEDRASNMSKMAQSTVLELQTELASSALWQESKLNVVSPQMLALKAMELCVRRLREANNRDRLLTATMLSQLMSMLGDVKPDAPNGKQEQGLDAGIQKDIILSLIESYTVADACSTDPELWSQDVLASLVQKLEFSLICDNVQESTLLLILRICISLANNNKRTSDAFARPGFLGVVVSMTVASFSNMQELPLEEALTSLDGTVLLCAALINLTECSDDVCTTILNHEPEGLNALIATFTASRQRAEEADSMETTQMNVAYGYLAVLLGNLCQNAELKRHVKSQLPGKTLKSLIEAVDEFVLHNQRTDQLGESQDGAWAAFTERLRAVADALKAGEE